MVSPGDGKLCFQHKNTGSEQRFKNFPPRGCRSIFCDPLGSVQFHYNDHARTAVRQVRGDLHSHRLSKETREVEDRAVGRRQFRDIDLAGRDALSSAAGLLSGRRLVFRLRSRESDDRSDARSEYLRFGDIGVRKCADNGFHGDVG